MFVNFAKSSQWFKVDFFSVDVKENGRFQKGKEFIL